MLSVLLRAMASNYPFGIFWPLCCQSFFELRLLIIPLVSFGHCVVSPSSSYGFWLYLWYLLAIVLSVLLRVTASDYPFGMFWPLCCQSFFELLLLIIPLVSFGHGTVCPSASDYPFGIFQAWCCLSFVFWLPLWYLLAMVLSVLRLLITPLLSFGHGVVSPSSSDYPFGIFWPWCCLSFVFWLHLWYLLAMVLSVLRLLITPLVSFGHGAVCPSSSDYPFGIFWPWCCLSFVLWLHLWYLLAMVL
jgi:hypothetical protein